jgi:hypothetical protein
VQRPWGTAGVGKEVTSQGYEAIVGGAGCAFLAQGQGSGCIRHLWGPMVPGKKGTLTCSRLEVIFLKSITHSFSKHFRALCALRQPGLCLVSNEVLGYGGPAWRKWGAAGVCPEVREGSV